MYKVRICSVEGPEGDFIRIETCCPNTIINIIKFCCVWLIHHCMLNTSGWQILKKKLYKSASLSFHSDVPPLKQWRTEGGVWGFKPPPPKFRRPSKIVLNSTRLWKLLKIAEFRTPTHQNVQKKGSKILKLHRFAIVLH